MAIQQDELQLRVTVEQSDAVKKVAGLTDEIKQIKEELAKLPGTGGEFNKTLNVLIKKQKEFAAVASKSDVRKAISALNRELNKTEKGTKEYKILVSQLRVLEGEMRGRIRDTKNFNRELSKAPQAAKGIAGGFQKIGSGLSGIVKASGIIFLIDKTIEWGRALFDTATELDALGTKFNTVFGDAAEIVEDYAAANSRALGISINQFKQLSTNTGDLLVPLGFARDEAANFASEITTLSGALSQWSGGQKSTADTSAILTKALLGEREELKSLGIAINETDVQQKLASKGLKEAEGETLKQAKALATLELILENSTDAQTAFLSGTNEMAAEQAAANATFAEAYDAISTGLISAWKALQQEVAPVIGFIGRMINLIREGTEVNPEFGESFNSVREFLFNLYEYGLKPAIRFIGALIESFITGKEATGEFSRPVNNVVKILQSLFNIGKQVVGFLFDLGKALFEYVAPIFKDFDLVLISLVNSIFSFYNTLISVANKIGQSGLAKRFGLDFKINEVELIDPDTVNKAADKASKELDKGVETIITNVKGKLNTGFDELKTEASKTGEAVGKGVKEGVKKSEAEAVAAIPQLVQAIRLKLAEINATEDLSLQIKLTADLEALQKQLAAAVNIQNKAVGTAEAADGFEAIDPITGATPTNIDENGEAVSLEDKLSAELEAFSEYYNQKSELDRDYTDEAIANDEELKKKREENLNYTFQIAKNFTNLLAQSFENQKQRELKAAGDNAEKRAEIERKYAEKQKRVAIAQALINTFESVTKTLTSVPYPFNIPLGILAFAQGIDEVNAIKNTEFAKGGTINAKGGVATSGQLHNGGGIKMIDGKTGQMLGEWERGEPYMILSRKTMANNGFIINRLLDVSINKNGAPLMQDALFNNWLQGSYLQLPKPFFAADGGIIGSAPNPILNNIPGAANSNNEASQQLAIQNQLLAELNENVKRIPTNLKATVIKDELDAQSFDTFESQIGSNI